MNEKQLEIVVLSREKAEEFVTDRAYLWISVRDPGSALVEMPANPNQVARLDLEFSDFDVDRCPRVANVPTMKVFTVDDAKSIMTVLGITEKYINLIVVNCEAGISRSAAIAGALSKILTNHDEYFFKHYLPNRYVYKTLLSVAMDSRPIGE